ncbi:hypothetical protein ACQEVI_24050 [Promicromonospora sp. CA-289599]|uniref:hypothetical protein n=1 Tax=Promicromonospora sp. CA-289599 TaxID=3240014 RepID=UPI003D8C7BCF
MKTDVCFWLCERRYMEAPEFWEMYAPGGARFAVAAICLPIMIFFLVLFLVRLVKVWRSNSAADVLIRNFTLSISKGDPERARGNVRAVVPIAMVGISLSTLALYVFLRLIPGFPWQYLSVATAMVLTNIYWGATWWTIIYFNRPKFLVPPHMRGDRGLRAVLRDRRAMEPGPRTVPPRGIEGLDEPLGWQGSPERSGRGAGGASDSDDSRAASAGRRRDRRRRRSDDPSG